MLELTLSFDALLEANRVSSETPSSARRVPSDAMDQARLRGSNLRYWGGRAVARAQGSLTPSPAGEPNAEK